MTRTIIKYSVLLLTILCLYGSLPSIGFAQTEATYLSTGMYEPEDGLFQTKDELAKPGEYLKSLLYVIIVLAVIICLIVILIRLLSTKNRSMLANRSIKTLSGIHFGQNKSLQIVEIGHAIYVVGVGENVQLIGKIEQAEEVSYIKEAIHNTEHMSVSNKLANVGRWFNRFQKTDTQDEVEDMMSFQDIFDQKMQRVKHQKSEIDQIVQNDIHRDRG